MQIHFTKQIHFTRLIKAGGRLREFNFRKMKQLDQDVFSVDTVDDRGNRMSPSIVRNRHGRRYTYYVSRACLTGQSDQAGAVTRMSAGEIQALVECRIRALLREPPRRA